MKIFSFFYFVFGKRDRDELKKMAAPIPFQNIFCSNLIVKSILESYCSSSNMLSFVKVGIFNE